MDSNPYMTPTADLDSRGLRTDPSLLPQSFFKAWFMFFLVATLGGAGAGFLVGALAGGVMGASGIDIETITLVCQGLGFVAALPISFLAYRWSVRTYLFERS
jgi:hypothetical protein